MDSIAQESSRKKKKKGCEKFLPPNFVEEDISTPQITIISDEIVISTTPTKKLILSDDEVIPTVSTAKKRRLRKKQALEKKASLTAKSTTNIEEDKSIVNTVCICGKSSNLVKNPPMNNAPLSNPKDFSIDVTLVDKPIVSSDTDILDRSDKNIVLCNSSADNLVAENNNKSVISSNFVNSNGVTMGQDSVDGTSRDKIKAEREAKKLAKQQQKLKKGTIQDAQITTEKSSLSESAKTLSLPNDLAKDDLLSKTEPITKNVNRLNIAVDEGNKVIKSKAELRAERRAIQETQRAAKEQASAAKLTAPTTVDKKIMAKDTPQTIPIQIKKTVMKLDTQDVKKAVEVKPSVEKAKIKMYQADHKVKLFQHLYAERETAICAPRISINSKEIHPSIMRLGVQYASGIVVGSNARCIALLKSLKEVVRDFGVPAQAEFGRALEARLLPGLAYLHRSRPLAVSMDNALKHFRYQLRQLPNDILESDAKIQLNEAIDTYIREQIEVAGQAISLAVRNKISNGDVILTYSCSSLVEQILRDAWSSGIRFRVIVVGARPRHEATVMLRRLTAAGLPCTLVDISALSHIMKGVSKVLLGAGALLANGSVVGRAGTATVALVAAAFNVPALVCCQTHKFSERVQADSFVYNEIGDPDKLVGDGPLQGWRDSGGAGVQPLQLLYDVTPPDLVAAVITELAILPCTSVPVVLRFKLSEYGI